MVHLVKNAVGYIVRYTSNIFDHWEYFKCQVCCCWYSHDSNLAFV